MLPIQHGIATRYPPVVTWGLIGCNCAVFFIQLSLTPRELDWFLLHFALIPARYFDPAVTAVSPLGVVDYLPFVSNMFLHGGWLHLILNMETFARIRVS